MSYVYLEGFRPSFRVEFLLSPMRATFLPSSYPTYFDYLNTFTAIVDLSRFNNSCLKSPASTLVDLTFQSRTLRSFILNQLRNLSL